MDNLQDRGTKHCVHSIFGRVPHGVKPASPLPATFFIFFTLSIRLAWYLSQYRRTAGSRKDLWCQKKVQPEYPQSSIWWNTSKTLLIDAPATKTPKLDRILPAGNFPRTVGYDFQEYFWWHCEQVWVTLTRVPHCLIVAFGEFPLQLKQNIVNSCNSML